MAIINGNIYYQTYTKGDTTLKVVANPDKLSTYILESLQIGDQVYEVIKYYATAQSVQDLNQKLEQLRQDITKYIDELEIDEIIRKLKRDCYVTSNLDDLSKVMDTGSVIYVSDNNINFNETIPEYTTQSRILTNNIQNNIQHDEEEFNDSQELNLNTNLNDINSEHRYTIFIEDNHKEISLEDNIKELSLE